MDLGSRLDLIEGVPVLALDGEADLGSLPRLHDRVRHLVSDHIGQRVVIDLDGLGHLDPVAVGVLVAGRLLARAGGGDLHIVCTNPAVAAVFTGSGLDATFTLHVSITQAAAPGAL